MGKWYTYRIDCRDRVCSLILLQLFCHYVYYRRSFFGLPIVVESVGAWRVANCCFIWPKYILINSIFFLAAVLLLYCGGQGWINTINSVIYVIWYWNIEQFFRCLLQLIGNYFFLGTFLNLIVLVYAFHLTSRPLSLKYFDLPCCLVLWDESWIK